jgi:hypothetical protein
VDYQRILTAVGEAVECDPLPPRQRIHWIFRAASRRVSDPRLS